MLRQFVGSVAVAAITAVPGVAVAAPITFTLGGTSQLMDTGLAVPPVDLSGLLGGRYRGGADVSIPFPATVVGMDYSVAVGANNLVTQLRSTPDEKRALGISQGAIAIAEAKRRLLALPADQRPAPRTLSFVAVADPTRPGHGALAQMGYQTPDTPYDTVYVTREYDGLADLPDRLNALALINAAAGIIYVHPHYGEWPADIPTKNITTTVNDAGGTVTDVLIPNPHLPMLQPLRDLGFDVDGVEAVLRPMVDAGYSRNDVKPAPRAVTAPAAATAEDSGNELRKPHRNVQASDAAHVKDDDQPAKANDEDPHRPDEKPGDEKPRDEKPVSQPPGQADDHTGEHTHDADADAPKPTATSGT
jgi:hypothetical protein